MTQLHPRDLDNRQQNRSSEKNSYKQLNGKLGIIGEKSQFVSVDLKGERNEVILVYTMHRIEDNRAHP